LVLTYFGVNLNLACVNDSVFTLFYFDVSVMSTLRIC